MLFPQLNDIVPELYDQIEKRYKTAVKTDPWIRSFMRRLNAGRAAQEDALTYVEKLGTHAADAFKTVFRANNLPYGKIYFNIAKRTIEPIMRDIPEKVNNAAVTIIEDMHEKRRITLKPKRTEFNQDRCDAIINKVVAASVRENINE